MESRLSKFIDAVYLKTRYFIWGPEVAYTDGSRIPEGREERITEDVEWDFPERLRI